MNMRPALQWGFICLAFVPSSIVLADEPTARHTLTGHGSAVTSVAFSPDGKTLASGSWDHTVKLWDVATGMERATLKDHSCGIGTVAFSPDGKIVAAAISGSPGVQRFLVKLWDVASAKEEAALKGNSTCGGIGTVAFSPDGKAVASGSANGTIKVCDAATGNELAALPVKAHFVLSLAFSPDGKTLAWASADKTVKLWDLTTGKERPSLSGHDGRVRFVAFSPDGKTLASTSDDKSIRLWDLATGKERAIFLGHAAPVRSVAFSPDGKTLASASSDQTIKLWEVATTKERATLLGHGKDVNSVAYSPDARILASASDDQTIKLWDEPLTKKAESVRGTKVTAAELDGNWTALAGEDAEKAYLAMGTLIAANDQTLLFFKGRLQPAPEPNVKEIARWIAALDSDEYAVRQKATEELGKLGDPVATALRTRLAGQPSPETRQRIEQLLNRFEQQPLSADALRTIRAVEVLEHIGTSDAKKALDTLATGAEGARLPREARAALERLNKTRAPGN